MAPEELVLGKHNLLLQESILRVEKLRKANRARTDEFKRSEDRRYVAQELREALLSAQADEHNPTKAAASDAGSETESGSSNNRFRRQSNAGLHKMHLSSAFVSSESSQAQGLLNRSPTKDLRTPEGKAAMSPGTPQHGDGRMMRKDSFTNADERESSSSMGGVEGSPPLLAPDMPRPPRDHLSRSISGGVMRTVSEDLSDTVRMALSDVNPVARRRQSMTGAAPRLSLFGGRLQPGAAAEQPPKDPSVSAPLSILTLSADWAAIPEDSSVLVAAHPVSAQASPIPCGRSLKASGGSGSPLLPTSQSRRLSVGMYGTGAAAAVAAATMSGLHSPLMARPGGSLDSPQHSPLHSPMVARQGSSLSLASSSDGLMSGRRSSFTAGAGFAIPAAAGAYAGRAATPVSVAPRSPMPEEGGAVEAEGGRASTSGGVAVTPVSAFGISQRKQRGLMLMQTLSRNGPQSAQPPVPGGPPAAPKRPTSLPLPEQGCNAA